MEIDGKKSIFTTTKRRIWKIARCSSFITRLCRDFQQFLYHYWRVHCKKWSKTFCQKQKRNHFCTCILLNPDINLKEMNQKIPSGGLIGYRNSCIDYFLHTPKFLDYMQFYMTLLDLWILLRKKCPGYCYAAPRLPSSCFLGHVTGLLFCLYVKIFAPSVYALFDCYLY